jgi:hypothetical protein
METFVGLDVSLGETSVCILDKDGTRIFDGKVASEPAPIARLIRKRAGVIRPSVPEAASVSLKASRAPRTLAARALSGIARLQSTARDPLSTFRREHRLDGRII